MTPASAETTLRTTETEARNKVSFVCKKWSILTGFQRKELSEPEPRPVRKARLSSPDADGRSADRIAYLQRTLVGICRMSRQYRSQADQLTDQLRISEAKVSKLRIALRRAREETRIRAELLATKEREYGVSCVL
jgi:hypothetical protein